MTRGNDYAGTLWRPALALAWACAALALGLACLAGGQAGVAYAADTGFTAAGLEPSTVGTQAASYDISWYEGKESPYYIKNLAQLKGLAFLVNGGTDSFEGKEVRLAEGAQIVFWEGDSIEPIGTVDHPFQGTFDGGRGSAAGGGIVAMVEEARIQNLTVEVGDRLSYIGLFGYAGDKANICNLSVFGGNSTISVATEEDGKAINYVGAIAGYLGGSMQNCYSSVDVSIVNNGKVSATAGKTAAELCTISYVGGLAGLVGGDVLDCKHADATVSITSKSSISEAVPYIAGFVGGIAGYQGDEEKPEFVPTLRNCSNSGPLTFTVSGSGGVDRFGQRMYSKSAMVGGIVGYEMGNVSDCSNTASIESGIYKDGELQSGFGASTVGGIVGSLRGPTIAESASAVGVVGSDETDPGYALWAKSKGKSEPPLLTIERCANTGFLVGLASVAGICGSTGAFTQIVACSNTAEVIGTRWNKPCPSGIVGITNGDVKYCYNTGRIVTLTGGGYYASGITALLTTYNTSTTDTAILLDPPEICGCYVTGAIVSKDAGYRAAVIAGENDGFIHDNCYLPNLVADKAIPKDWAAILDNIGDTGTIAAGHEDEVKELVSRINALDRTSLAVSGSAGAAKLVDNAPSGKGSALDVLYAHCSRSQIVEQDEDRGTLANNHELTAAELRTSFGISLLNKVNGTNGDWSVYYVANPNSSGFPLLSWQGKPVASPVDLSSASVVTVSLAEGGNPQYSAAITPIPRVEVSLNGTPLYQNADYRVIPQEGAREVGGGYEATIEGMDGYAGTLAQTVAYEIEKCQISNCKVAAGSVTFNWERRKPSWVKVIDEVGNEVDSSEYSWSTLANDDFDTTAKNGKYYDYINVHNASYQYDIKVDALPSSAHYTGETVQPAFHIRWASMYYSSDPSSSDDPTAQFDKVVWGKDTWDYKEARLHKGLVKIKYTGQPIEPTVANPTYLGRPLRDGTGKNYSSDPLSYDFKYVYGNPNPEKLAAAGVDCIDVTGSEETDLACMTLRFTPGGNFDNYDNVFFEIVPASMKDDVKVAGIGKSYAYTGKSVKPKPTLTYNGMTLVKGTDYTVSYKNNKKVGKASIVLAGKGNYTGKVTKTFKIEQKANPVTVKAKKAVTVKHSALAKKSQTITRVKLMTISKAKGTLAYAKASVTDKKYAKYFSVNKKSGKLTVKKGLPKGLYKVALKVKATGGGYKAVTKTVTVQVRVK